MYKGSYKTDLKAYIQRHRPEKKIASHIKPPIIIMVLSVLFAGIALQSLITSVPIKTVFCLNLEIAIHNGINGINKFSGISMINKRLQKTRLNLSTPPNKEQEILLPSAFLTALKLSYSYSFKSFIGFKIF